MAAGLFNIAEGVIGSFIDLLITPSNRSIATIIPDVVIDEHHRDELIITQHPVEKGAAITDHAFKRPSEVDMRCGFSNSSAGYEGYAEEVYQELLALQKSRRPFALSTGKRNYQNMLLRALAIVTDPTSENALMVSASFQEIIIVSTQVTGTGTNTASAGASQASPQSTGSTSNTGDTQATDVSPTAFGGAYNPGATGLDGNPQANGSFTLDGISPAPYASVGEMKIEAIDGVPVSGGSTPYNIFEFG